MRVVAGLARGRRLGPVPPGTRPVSDRAREGLFSSLGPSVAGAEVLDLYAGTGAMGIEALSRGAAHATFVDASRRAVAAISDNLDRTGLTGQGAVVHAEVMDYLHRGPDAPDLVLADPPYELAEEAVDALLQALSALLPTPGARAVLTRPHKGYMPVIPVDWAVARELRYGDTLVLVFKV